jgi:hypothetical protein
MLVLQVLLLLVVVLQLFVVLVMVGRQLRSLGQ